MIVYYEQLVLHPEKEMRRLLESLQIPWNASVLHHEELIGKDISLSKYVSLCRARRVIPEIEWKEARIKW